MNLYDNYIITLKFIIIFHCILYVFQVDIRDQEIVRLSRQLEGGKPYDVMTTEAKNRSNERLISHLNVQVSQSIYQSINQSINQLVCSGMRFSLYLVTIKV